jgi:predicted Zn-dependent protease with MMP-like domain
MREEAFRALVEEGIDALPEWVRTELVNVAFLVAHVPTEKQRIENNLDDTETLFGLYEGVPLTERGNEAVMMPDTITIFMTPILETYTEEKDIQACVNNTIWHEVAHYFGHDEAWVEAEEVRRNKTI